MAAKEFTRFGAEQAHLEVAWQDRLAEAQTLQAARRHAAAIASAIYALEIRLKVLVCKRLDLPNLPTAFEIHDLDSLLLAGLSRKLERKGAKKVKENWTRIASLAIRLNDLRYLPASHWTTAQATAVLTALTDPNDGVLSWLSKQR